MNEGYLWVGIGYTSLSNFLTIENDKLHSIFLHVVFGSQSLLKSTSDQTGSDTN
jgi:hypothetical protein